MWCLSDVYAAVRQLLLAAPRDSGVSGVGVGMSATSNPGVIEGSTAAQSDSPKSLLMSAPASPQPPALSSMGSGSAVNSLAMYSLSMDEDVDEEMQQLGSSSASRPSGVATMPPSWRNTPMVGSSSSSTAHSSSNGSSNGTSNGNKQAQQHLQPGSVVNDIVPMKSKIGGASGVAAAEQRKVQQAEQGAKVQ